MIEDLKLTQEIYVVFDLETTGLYPNSGDTIIEIVTQGESHSNHTTDTTSLLQGNGAYSIATISNGTLQHTLTIEPRQDSITIQVQEIHTIDSISYRHPPKEKESKATPSWVYLLIIITITAISTKRLVSLNLRRVYDEKDRKLKSSKKDYFNNYI